MKPIDRNDAVHVTGGVISGPGTPTPGMTSPPQPIVEYPQHPTTPVEPLEPINTAQP